MHCVVYVEEAIHQSEEDRHLSSQEPCFPGLLGSPGAAMFPGPSRGDCLEIYL